MVIYGIHCYGRKLEGKNERATVKGFLCEGVRFLLPMIFAVLASGVLLVPTALALIGRSSGESSGGSANAESLSVLLGSGNATKILKGLFFPQLRLSGDFLFTVWFGIRNVDADGACCDHVQTKME